MIFHYLLLRCVREEKFSRFHPFCNANWFSLNFCGLLLYVFFESNHKFFIILHLINEQIMNASELIEQAKKYQTSVLDLSNAGLSEIPYGLYQLERLKELNLSNNKIRKIKNLPARLTTLKINENKISRIENLPPGLKTLQISQNQIEKLENFPLGLTELKISNNYISKLENLPEGLKELYLIDNRDINTLENLPRSLTNLYVGENNIRKLENLPQQLFKLNISKNNIKRLENLPPGLSILIINDNQITKLENLPQMLGTLEISNNQISEVENLPEGLINLYVTNNQIEKLHNLPEGLRILDVEHNKISKFEKLPKTLWKFAARSNKISDLTPLLFDLSDRRIPISLSVTAESAFWFGDNPLTTPPPEIVRQGTDAVLKYFAEIEKGMDYLFEAKLLIVGEPGAGKTTLFRKLENPNSPLPFSEETTKGIDIHSLTLQNKISGKTDFRVNLWDFGGQTIYHATHQFFLTKRSLYILVTDGRRENTDFNYWLQVIELLSGSSPVIIVQNEKDSRKPDIDVRGLQDRFKNIKEMHSLDLSSDVDKIKKLKDAISYHIQQLDHVGQELPTQWIDVRKKLETSSNKVPYITRDEYLAICNEKGIKDKVTARILSGYLHDIGSFLHFQDDPLLSHYLFLRNEWATDAVYAIFDDDIIKSGRKGHFDKDDIIRILNTEDYHQMHDEVIQLMVKFELAYRIPDQTKNQYVIPQLLKVEKPRYEWNNERNIYLIFQYTFLPKGLMSRINVKLHCYAANFEQLWRSGAILYRSDTRAEVIETYGERKISIRVEGKNSKELLTIISETIDLLNKGYETIEYEKMVPCNCEKCKDAPIPFFFKHSVLQKRLERGRNTIDCEESLTDVRINQLLDGVFTDRSSIARTEPTESSMYPLKFFISYSKHDTEDLERFKKVLAPLRIKGLLITWDDTDIIPAEEWDDRIEEKISDADVIVFLTSIDSLATNYIASREMQMAAERQKKSEVLILPIILDDSLWEKTILANFNALPVKGKPIHSKQWDTIDVAWTNVGRGIDRLISEFQNRRIVYR